MWFARCLLERGHDIVAAVRGTKDSYSGLRAERLARLGGQCEFAWGQTFGSPEFLDLAGKGRFDVLCHHAADAKDYKSPDFDVTAAVGANTRALRSVLQRLRDGGCRRIVLTGSVFEANEGAGSKPMRAFSAYGLSKTLTSEAFSFHAEMEGFALGKFVIPNPFGPLEEPRFTDYLLRCWKEGKTARVNTPSYVRDNIHVSLLAAAYAQFVAALPEAGTARLNPSQYVESQGTFARRFASEIGGRLKIEATVELGAQTDFSEPLVRINTDVMHGTGMNWSEPAAWDELSKYYAGRFDVPLQ